MTDRNRNIFLFTALPCEAKPVIERFKLKKNLAVRPFEVYVRDDICLTVTGIGKIAMAAGLAYTMARNQPAGSPVLLNVGIAGHGHHALGSLFLIDKISDEDNGKNFFPPMVFSPPCPTAELITVSAPRTQYHANGLIDMEASAFYETATRFTTSELAQCVKVISDNSCSPADRITPGRVSQWIGDILPKLETVLAELTELSSQLDWPEPRLLDEIGLRFHVTSSQRMTLRNQLNRWRCLTGSEPNIDWSRFSSAKEFSNWLVRQIDTHQYDW